MNQGRIWCVVKPTVGLPLFLGAVAITSLVVHTAVLLNTDWYAGFMQGGKKAKTAAMAPAAPVVAVAPPAASK
jgi:light-harvesting protein B-800-850 alpha chain